MCLSYINFLLCRCESPLLITRAHKRTKSELLGSFLELRWERERERENEGGLAWGFCLERFSLLVAASSAPTWFIISMMMMNRWTSSKGRHYITVSWVSRTMKRGRNLMPTMEITTERQERRKVRKKGNKISWSWFEIPARVFLLFRQQYIIQTGCLSLSLSLFFLRDSREFCLFCFAGTHMSSHATESDRPL